MPRWRVITVVHKQLYGFAFLRSSLFVITMVFYGFLELSFSVLQSETTRFHDALPLGHKGQADRERKKVRKNSGIWLCPFGACYSSTEWNGMFLSLESFNSYSQVSLCQSVSLLLPQPPPWDFLDMREGRKRRENPRGFPPSLSWVLVVPFSKKSTLSQNMCSKHSAHFHVLLCFQAREYGRKKSSKVTTSSVVLGTLIFFPDSSADNIL